MEYIIYVILAFVAFCYAVLLGKHLLNHYDLYKKAGALALLLALLFGSGFAARDYMLEQERITEARLAAIYSLQEQQTMQEAEEASAPPPKPAPTPKPKPEPKPAPVSNEATVLSFSQNAMIRITKDDIDPDDLRCLGILSKTEELLNKSGLANENSQRDFDKRELELYSKYDFVVPTAWITQAAEGFTMTDTFVDTVMSCLED